MTIAADTFSAIADLSAAYEPPSPAAFDDDSLLRAQQVLAEIARRVDATAALISAEISHRSRPELGYKGLAQSRGARTPQALVQHLTGFTSRQANTLVRVGALMSTPVLETGEPAPDPTPWLKSVATAVAAGRLSLEAADAIRAALGAPDDDEVPAEALAHAAEALVSEAADLSVERLAARARELRNELDASRVAEREERLRQQEYLRITDLGNGLSKLDAVMATESAARARAIFDAATSPRRGGPRFVDPEAADRAQELLDDPRTTAQIALDVFLQLLELGAATDPAELIGGRRPPVQILVTDHDVRARAGYGYIEGQSDAVSISTVERYICQDGTVPILFEGGQVINLGRNARLFTRFQKMGIAMRDGGCIVPGCDRPPSWTEVHHINEWQREGGKTDIADGVLLCKHHHLMVHNNGWRVIREGAASYFLVPPPDLDPLQRPIPCPSKSAVRRRSQANQRELTARDRAVSVVS